MNELAIPIIEKYGLFGITLLFTGWIVTMLLKYFMGQNSQSIQSMHDMAKEFSETNRSLTEAIHKMNEQNTRNNLAIDKIAETFDRNCDLYRQEHAQILDFVRARHV